LVYVSEVGDTMVSMYIGDAKVLLEDVLHYEYSDSLLTVYKEKDSLSTNTINMQKEVLMNMGQEKMNLEAMNKNLEEIIANKDEENSLLNDVIKQQKKEIRKQKFLKIIGFTGAVVLPVVVLIATL
jgi:hypothetical protein